MLSRRSVGRRMERWLGRIRQVQPIHSENGWAFSGDIGHVTTMSHASSLCSANRRKKNNIPLMIEL